MPTMTVWDMLETVRLAVPVQKMRLQHLARALTVDLTPEISAGTLTVKADVTRATGLAEAFTTGYPRIGWQFQGDAFRLCLEPSPELARDTPGWDQTLQPARAGHWRSGTSGTSGQASPTSTSATPALLSIRTANSA
jgi:hypothetical protein